MALVSAEQVVRTWLAGEFPNPIRVLFETPADMSGSPVIRVHRFGGSDDPMVLDFANLAVECYANADATRSAYQVAGELAEQVRTSLRHRLPGQTVAGGFVPGHGVSTIQAPIWTPYDNTILRRFTASYRIAVRSTPI